MFQSAPRVLLRGDRSPVICCPARESFNPRPAFFCGATKLLGMHAVGVHSFNPRPAFFCGATPPSL